MMTPTPLQKRAATISASVTFGPGKKEFFQELVKDAVGKHCIYCLDMLTLESMSLDHIQPFGLSSHRNNKMIALQLNKPGNFRIICKKCNTMKGNLDHKRFAAFMAFLNQDPILKAYVYKKMTQSSLMYGFAKRAQTSR